MARRSTLAPVFDEVPSADDLLHAWQDAIQAADLAERLARVALETSAQLDANAVELEAIATLAEHVAAAAENAATTARQGAIRAHATATRGRDTRGAHTAAAAQAREDEAVARRRYHEADRLVERSR